MMRRFWYFLTDSRRVAIIGFIALAAIFFLGAEALELALIWALGALAATLLVAGIVWWVRRRVAKRQSDLLGDAIGQSSEPATLLTAGAAKSDGPREEVDTIRDSMLKAIATIKGSKLGLMSGKRALYELPCVNLLKCFLLWVAGINDLHETVGKYFKKVFICLIILNY